jgi:ABC-type dipeptide/oligopeptide/nickel transport system permease component
VSATADIARHLILPVITLVVVNIAGDSRFVRASMLEALGQD